MYDIACCTCNKTVRTDKMILKGPLLILITFIETYDCHRIIHDQPGHLLSDHQLPVDQPARLLGQDNMIEVIPRLRSRLVRGRRDRSTLDFEINFFSSLTILWGSLTLTAFTEDLLVCPYTRYVCELFQLFHHMRLDI